MQFFISCKVLVKSSQVLLLFLFCWNSVFAGTEGIILCLHKSGDMHVELAGEKFERTFPDCNESKVQIGDYECLSCTDILLEAADLGPIRPNELVPVELPTLNVSEVPFILTAIGIPDKLRFQSWNRTRAPPGVEPTSQQISRVIVLRL